jgi:hypothetical protein
MAETKTVLVNDGGAPARIMNFLTGEAIEAGEALKMHTDGLVMLADNKLVPIIGFALTDAADDSMVSCVTGHGIILNVITDAVTCGDQLSVDASSPGFLETATAYNASAESDKIEAIALETNATTDTMTKVMVL